MQDMQVNEMIKSIRPSVRDGFWRILTAVLWMVLTVGAACAAENEAAFEIRVYEISGNSLFTADTLREIVRPFTGAGKTAADVEKARDALEKFYHTSGYPAVLVNIPEQNVADGIVYLRVLESRVGRVKISGNRYFTTEKMLRELQSFNPGEMLYLPKVQEELGRLNRNQDIKVEPLMTPGSEPGKIDIELKVEDKLPLHGYLELNNKATHDTSDLRLNAMLRYDNLWQRAHSIAFQYQTSPQDTNEVEALSAAYVLPAPWNEDHQWVFFGVWSDSNTAFGEGFQVTGKGKIFGTRYAVPLPPYKLYAHNITLGLDYKDFKEDVGFTTESGETTHTPVTYLPLSIAYGSVLQDSWGLTQFSAGLNMSFRGIVSDQREFEAKRYKGTAGYFYVKADLQRNQKLPRGMGLLMKAEGQVSDSPLIDNEQYTAAGMESVRGYKESEALGDDAVCAKLELSFPDPLEKSAIGKWFQMSPFIFYDFAYLGIKDPLGGQSQSARLEGAGAGLRGTLTRYCEYEMDWAFALSETDKTKSGDYRFYFKLKAVF
jgi:hemolysin activation/secretion protein